MAAWKLSLSPFVVGFLLMSIGSEAVSNDGFDYSKCSMAVETWADQALEDLMGLPENHNQDLKELLYFLHVPRTGGRTYHHCLLSNLYPREQHCDRSYDELRFNSSKLCRLLVTHDDYSVLTKLPVSSTSVVTNIRHPIDRFFSAYEFSVEVASRFLTVKKIKADVGNKIDKSRGSNTLNIWPWNLLVPWMWKDLVTRREAKQWSGVQAYNESVSHYNASFYAMPLHEFMRHPIVVDLLHNGATFQVAGLTNNSYDKGAVTVRKCVIDFPELGQFILDVAKGRMEKMLFVGLTEKHEDSAKLFAQVIAGQSYEKLTGDSLIKKYENCSARLRSKQVQRCIVSLKDALPVNFSTEARREVGKETLEAIERMNNLDLELYSYAQVLFSRFLNHKISNMKATFDSKMLSSSTTIDDQLQDLYQPSILLILLFICGAIISTAAVVLKSDTRLGHGEHIKV